MYPLSTSVTVFPASNEEIDDWLESWENETTDPESVSEKDTVSEASDYVLQAATEMVTVHWPPRMKVMMA